MFKVENADFIADKLAAELLPDQEFREGYKNAEEAVNRRRNEERKKGAEPSRGRIEFDIDWPLHAQSGSWYISVADNGDGMSRSELEKYMTTLAVTGANQNQSITGNQGMGLKIAGPTRHREGVLIRSLKGDDRTMVQVGWTGREYDLIPLNDRGDFIVEVPEDLFPDFVRKQGSGTVVTYLGSEPGVNTVVPEGRSKNWLFKYLFQRFFRLAGDDMTLLVRQPAKDVSEWPQTREEAESGKWFNQARVSGTAEIWDDASDRQEPGMRGIVDLPGVPSADIPPARIHWWVLPPTGSGNDVTSRTAGGGSLAVLFQNELHDWRTGGQANPFFARLGVIFAKTRITFVLEPLGGQISSDFARAHVLVDGRPALEGEAWAVWADQFRDKMPDAIKRTIAQEQQRLHEEDPDRARRIRDRLKDVMQMLRPRSARRDPKGSTLATGPEITGGGSGEGEVIVTEIGPGTRRPTARPARGVGALLPQIDVEEGEQATETFALLKLHPRWVTEAEANDFPIVKADGRGLSDRAAALSGVDGISAADLLLNLDFRGYQMILQHLSEWANPDGDEDIAKAIETYTQEWIEQKMVEAVTGLRQLENGSTWTATAYDEAFSPAALTAAFMADRYHTVREVKRQIGPLRRETAVGAVAS